MCCGLFLWYFFIVGDERELFRNLLRYTLGYQNLYILWFSGINSEYQNLFIVVVYLSASRDFSIRATKNRNICNSAL